MLKAAGVITAFAAIILAGMMNNSRRVRARDDDGGDERDESRIRRGLEIAPVHLNLEGRNPALVGLGSYIVNAVGDCNGCHSAGPQKFAKGGNPYFLSPPFSGKVQINTATYLFRRWARFWPRRLSSLPLLPQFDAGQDWAA